jgi:hypothetical protein
MLADCPQMFRLSGGGPASQGTPGENLPLNRPGVGEKGGPNGKPATPMHHRHILRQKNAGKQRGSRCLNAHEKLEPRRTHALRPATMTPPAHSIPPSTS